MSTPILAAIWAQTENGILGNRGAMPWYAPEDLAYFKERTMGSPVIMGRRTWESFAPAFRPLPGRTNIVISSDTDKTQAEGGAVWVRSPEEALASALEGSPEIIWVIGGGMVYRTFLEATGLAGVAHGRVSRIERTVFSGSVEGDTSAPKLPPNFVLQDCLRNRSVRGYLLGPDGRQQQPLDYRIERWDYCPQS